ARLVDRAAGQGVARLARHQIFEQQHDLAGLRVCVAEVAMWDLRQNRTGLAIEADLANAALDVTGRQLRARRLQFPVARRPCPLGQRELPDDRRWRALNRFPVPQRDPRHHPGEAALHADDLDATAVDLVAPSNACRLQCRGKPGRRELLRVRGKRHVWIHASCSAHRDSVWTEHSAYTARGWTVPRRDVAPGGTRRELLVSIIGSCRLWESGQKRMDPDNPG